MGRIKHQFPREVTDLPECAEQLIESEREQFPSPLPVMGLVVWEGELPAPPPGFQ